MKKLHLLGMTMIIALAFASCGSNKQMVNNQPQQQPQQQQTVQQQTQPQPQQSNEDAEIAALKKRIEIEKLKKQLEDEMRRVDPCGGYYDDADYMRDYGIATGENPASAQSASIEAAKANLRKHMEEFVQGFSTSYLNDYAGSKPTDDIHRKIEGETKAAIQGALNRSEKLCQEYKMDTDGVTYMYYAAFQISVNKLKKDISNRINNKLTDDEKRRIDFEQIQFEKRWDNDYQKMLDAQKNADY